LDFEDFGHTESVKQFWKNDLKIGITI